MFVLGSMGQQKFTHQDKTAVDACCGCRDAKALGFKEVIVFSVNIYTLVFIKLLAIDSIFYVQLQKMLRCETFCFCFFQEISRCGPKMFHKLFVIENRSFQ